MQKRKPSPRTSSRYTGARYEICRRCGQNWNVSAGMQLSAGGYLCPHCCRKKRGDHHDGYQRAVVSQAPRQKETEENQRLEA